MQNYYQFWSFSKFIHSKKRKGNNLPCSLIKIICSICFDTFNRCFN